MCCVPESALEQGAKRSWCARHSLDPSGFCDVHQKMLSKVYSALGMVGTRLAHSCPVPCAVKCKNTHGRARPSLDLCWSHIVHLAVHLSIVGCGMNRCFPRTLDYVVSRGYPAVILQTTRLHWTLALYALWTAWSLTVVLRPPCRPTGS
ncbi:hypothetical protein AMTRI_Chr07g80760 [Amborella trichopoda]|uniref:Uncharacterized protein n=1 Tax=Amborella trichopoda TaxID=13333 RepID=W1NGS2_AMBTC|nr:hypothetical protein AMTR_s00009p00235690 [Amborella trichopoda]